MSKNKSAPAGEQASLDDGAASAEQAAKLEADRIAGEQAAKLEADRIAAEQAVRASLARGVLQRRECIAGIWYPIGVVFTAPAATCEALRGDGALDMHPDAIDYALRNGAAEVEHQPPAPAVAEA